MDRPTNIFSLQRPYEAEGVNGKCGYCGRRLASVAFIYSAAKPSCGSAWCLQQALLASEQAQLDSEQPLAA